jgi:hypothetical protein
VNVIVLNREVNHSEDVAQALRGVCLRDSLPHLADDALPTKWRQPGARTERDVHWMRAAMPFAPPVGNVLALGRRRSPSAVAPTTPFVEFELKLHLN